MIRSLALSRLGRAWLLATILGASAPATRAVADAPSAAKVSFQRQIRPLFQAECQGCHQPAKAKGDYVMTDATRLRQPGKSGETPIVPEHPETSHLLQLITPKNGEADMPKGRPPLSAENIGSSAAGSRRVPSMIPPPLPVL